MYKCIKCGSEFAEMPKGLIRCPACAHKVVMKVREPLSKEVQAR